MKYCNNCQQLVEPKSSIGWTTFWILFFCCFPLMCIYVVVLAFSEKKCPMCNSTNWGPKPIYQPFRDAHMGSEAPPVQAPVIQEQQKYCPACGTLITEKGVKFCPECGNAM